MRSWFCFWNAFIHFHTDMQLMMDYSYEESEQHTHKTKETCKWVAASQTRKLKSLPGMQGHSSSCGLEPLRVDVLLASKQWQESCRTQYIQRSWQSRLEDQLMKVHDHSTVDSNVRLPGIWSTHLPWVLLETKSGGQRVPEAEQMIPMREPRFHGGLQTQGPVWQEIHYQWLFKDPFGCETKGRMESNHNQRMKETSSAENITTPLALIRWKNRNGNWILRVDLLFCNSLSKDRKKEKIETQEHEQENNTIMTAQQPCYKKKTHSLDKGFSTLVLDVSLGWCQESTDRVHGDATGDKVHASLP